MKLSEIFKVADDLAPKALSDEYCARYDAYDNSGILVDTGKEITKILFSLDFSLSAIEKAKEIGAELIITHHPAIYGKIDGIRSSELLGKKLVACIENGISVLSMHLNLDCAVDGIDETLMQGVRLASGERSEWVEQVTVMHPLSSGGYGRAYAVKPCTAGELLDGIKREFSMPKAIVYGGEKSIKKASSFCGAGADEEALRFAKEVGADVIISADFKHHLIANALENGLAVVALTHYGSENYGFKKYYEKISRRIGVSCEYHEDTALI
ncbi:MAG: Nif3-like dinuclear metal center hexameric protein [Clostridia bacterium]|nr:Nif3-like dinuclear metal center hexameric protein [Clostridia bacterium]